MEINKEELLKSISYNMKMLFRKDVEEATNQQIYQALSYSLKDFIVDSWMDFHKLCDEQDA